MMNDDTITLTDRVLPSSLGDTRLAEIEQHARAIISRLHVIALRRNNPLAELSISAELEAIRNDAGAVVAGVSLIMKPQPVASGIRFEGMVKRI